MLKDAQNERRAFGFAFFITPFKKAAAPDYLYRDKPER